jgi:GNAT superfamily N-acetyltransferase
VTPGALNETLEEVRSRVAEGRTILVFSGPPLSEFGALTDPTGGITSASDLRSAFAAHFSEAVGTAAYEPREGYLYVGRVAVHPDWRRKGIGRMLMKDVEQIAPPLGLTRLRLGTRESMPSNVAFYEQLGYRIVERQPHSRGPDVILWFEKELEALATPAELVEKLASTISPLIGNKLKSVFYKCLSHEMKRSEIDGPLLYIGGEVELSFESIGLRYLSWDRTGWRSPHYCINVSQEPFVGPDYITRFGAGQTFVWKRLVGKVLNSIGILGWDGVPYVLRFGFDTGNAYIGSGYERGFGDGDDVLVRSEEEWQAHHSNVGMELLWQQSLPKPQ